MEDENIVTCRICKVESRNDLIVSPCLCKGSMGYVHVKCLERWLNISSRDSCELCSYKFNVIQTRRYTCLQSLGVWIRQEWARGVVFRSILFVLLSSVNTCLLTWIWGIWVLSLIKAASKINSPESATNSESDVEVNMTKWLIVFFFLTLLVSLSVRSMCSDIAKVVNEHIRAWYTWWRGCVNVKLVIDKECRSIPLEPQVGPSDSFLAKPTTNVPDSRSDGPENNSKMLNGDCVNNTAEVKLLQEREITPRVHFNIRKHVDTFICSDEATIQNEGSSTKELPRCSTNI